MMTLTEPTPHSALWIAVLAVILFCTAATMAVTRWIPDANERTEENVELVNPDNSSTLHAEEARNLRIARATKQ
jgi:hypothetical protein